MTGSVMTESTTAPVTTRVAGRTDLAAHAARLVAASAAKSLDPFTDVDWSPPFDDTSYSLPPACLPLFGTPEWDALSERQRIEYSRHEVAALCATGIWLENVLVQLLAQHLYDLPATDGTHRYLLVEIADECRHSTMFGELIRRAGTPHYLPTSKTLALGRVVTSGFGESAGFVAILAAEELLDSLNRATMRDRTIHPVSRDVARLHVTEEARHVSFAKKFLGERFPTLSSFARARVRLVAPWTVRVIADSLVHRRVYETLGIEGGYEAARNNPLHRARVVNDLEKLTGFLEEIGVIDPWTRPLWHKLGLLSPAS